MKKDYHIGLIVKDKERSNVRLLLDKFTEKIKNDFHASVPAKEKLVGEYHGKKN